MNLLRKYKIWKLVGHDKEYHELFSFLDKIINNLYTKEVIVKHETYYYKDSFIFNIDNTTKAYKTFTFSTYIQSMVFHKFQIYEKTFMELVVNIFENHFNINIYDYHIKNSIVVWL